MENEYSIRDKYRLTLFGLFLAIEFFYNPRITTVRIVTDDNSRKDIERSEKFLDSIAKNYTDYLPLIFTKWDILKSINLNTTSLIKSILHPEPKIRNWMRTLSDIHLFTKMFNSDEKQITGMFYYDFICDYGTKLNEEQKIALGDKVMQEIKKILKIIKYKTQMEKLDVEINEDYIESATYSKLDKKITKMRKLEENPLLFKNK